VDVGKAEHHACALDPSGAKLHNKALPNGEAALTAVLSGLTAHGRVLVVIDQPASIGALTIAVARNLSIDVAYLPGLAMRRSLTCTPGGGKTDARDAYTTAAAARTCCPRPRRARPHRRACAPPRRDGRHGERHAQRCPLRTGAWNYPNGPASRP